MSEAKPFASLSSGLLARKGGAKPAMRPQAFGQIGASLEDLGWNDMGYGAQPQVIRPEPVEHVPSSIAALTPAPKPQEEAPAEIAPPPVVEQQRAIVSTFGSKPRNKPKAAKVVPLPARTPVASRTTGKAKSAFTLRLDPERHLRLRLACAVTGRSAQQIVTEALDEYLNGLPELENLAQQVPAQFGKRN